MGKGTYKSKGKGETAESAKRVLEKVQADEHLTEEDHQVLEKVIQRDLERTEGEKRARKRVERKAISAQWKLALRKAELKA
eukprot:7461586-Karenia_brevis.AAC.1